MVRVRVVDAHEPLVDLCVIIAPQPGALQISVHVRARGGGRHAVVGHSNLIVGQ